ncbi:hypothetical protein [Meiothermus rufus]|uniref:hypothetical protein n=1 Tax=Meiothermus rufus TaxID=604332 RepID=UPI00040EC882|nr:hypothetical protein [Meiothermus rufus]
MKAKFAHTALLPGLEVPGAVLRPFAGEQLMLLRAESQAGSLLAVHEQITLVVSGRLGRSGSS